MHHLDDVLSDAGLEPLALRTDYSGRHMYGRHCVALVGTLTELCRFVAELGRVLGLLYDDHAAMTVDDLREAEDTEAFIMSLLRDVRSDSMGLDTVWYFPNVEVAS
jgi:hypothetical protein